MAVYQKGGGWEKNMAQAGISATPMQIANTVGKITFYMVNGFPPKMSTTTPAARVTHSHTIKAATAAVAGQAAVLQGKDLFQFCSHLELTICTQQFFPDACIYVMR